MGKVLERSVDPSGRVTLPIDARRALGVWCQDKIQLYIDGDQVILRRSAPECVFCGSSESVRLFHGRAVCAKCYRSLRKLPLPKPYIPFDQCT